jgi:hypothetical protein
MSGTFTAIGGNTNIGGVASGYAHLESPRLSAKGRPTVCVGVVGLGFSPPCYR